MEDGARVVIVGGGWIGMEVAASARQLGLHVTVLDHAPDPVRARARARGGSVLPRPASRPRVECWARRGFEGKRAVEAAVTAEGRRISCDLVVGIGVVPRIELAYDRIPYFSRAVRRGDGVIRPRPDLGPRVVFRGDPATHEFVAFWIAGERVVAGMDVNVWDVREPIKELIRKRALVTAAHLAYANHLACFSAPRWVALRTQGPRPTGRCGPAPGPRIRPTPMSSTWRRSSLPESSTRCTRGSCAPSPTTAR